MSINEFNKIYNRVEPKKGKLAKRMSDRIRQEQAERASIVEQYQKIKNTKGDLFDMSVQPIEEDELQSIRSRKRKALRRIYIIAGCFALAITFFISREPAETRPQDPLEIIEMLLVATLAGGWWWFTNKNFDRILSLREKTVIKGVVTDKISATEKRDSEGAAAFFEISLQELVQVSARDYHKYAVGDCLQIEILSDDMMINRKVIKTGRLQA
jgi:hypothetical protein